MMRRRTRREVLHLAVAGTGGFITATVISDVADAASSTTSEADGVLGTLVEGGSSEITVQARSGKDVVVRTAASSRLGSGADGTVASLSDFVLGDTVVATGEFDESGILTADFGNSLLVERTLRVEDISPARGRDERTRREGRTRTGHSSRQQSFQGRSRSVGTRTGDSGPHMDTSNRRGSLPARRDVGGWHGWSH